MNNVQKLFDTWAGTERGENMAAGHDVLVSYILDMWDFRQVTRLLDAGCGNGRALMHAYKRGAENLAGIDMSKKMIAEAKKNIPEADLHSGSIDNLHMWQDDTFSHIISIEALYYLPDLPAGLKELCRVGQPDGKIAVAIDFYTENEGSHSWAEATGLSLQLLSSAEWIALFEEAGFNGVQASRIVRHENVKTEHEFVASPYFPDYATYLKYIQEGALLLTN